MDEGGQSTECGPSQEALVSFTSQEGPLAPGIVVKVILPHCMLEYQIRAPSLFHETSFNK